MALIAERNGLPEYRPNYSFTKKNYAIIYQRI